jgi:hypothetical protein
MNNEFTLNGKNELISVNGFTVKINGGGGATYRDVKGEVHIETEAQLNRPGYIRFKPPLPGILIYKPSLGRKGYENLDQARIDTVCENIKRALEYLGHTVEVWIDGVPPPCEDLGPDWKGKQ